MSETSQITVESLTVQSAASRLVHCVGQSMRWVRGSTTWTGKPGEGHEHDSITFSCDGCGAELTIKLSTPC